MIENFDIFETQWTSFVLLNWFFSICSTISLVFLVRRRRYLFVKPSFQLTCFSHLLFQWPMTIYAGYFETFLNAPYHMFFLVHAYVLAGIMIGPYVFSNSARLIWGRLSNEQVHNSQNVLITVVSVSLALFFSILYLYYVPPSESGLYAILTQPWRSDWAREESLKFLDSALPRYAYSALTTGLAPFLVVLQMFALYRNFRRRLLVRMFFNAVVIVFLFIMASITGARAQPVNILLTMAIGYWYFRRCPVSPVKILLVSAILFMPATLISVLRESKELNFDVVGQYLVGIFNRAFVVPLNVGSWHMEYVQTHGYWGVAGIPKLANLVGVAPVSTVEVIGSIYIPGRLYSSTANVGYLFAYYSYFGLLSVFVSICGMFLLDSILLVLKRCPKAALLPGLSAIMLTTLSFIQSDYSTVWVSQGFGFCFVFLGFLSALFPGANPATPTKSHLHRYESDPSGRQVYS